MRLSKDEIKAIKSSIKASVDGKFELYLFGSRTDDNKLGGDIDLFLECENPSLKLLTKIKAKLYEALGEQKIDLVLAKPKDNRLIVKEAKAGIRL